jgi:hypothetical protein
VGDRIIDRDNGCDKGSYDTGGGSDEVSNCVFVKNQLIGTDEEERGYKRDNLDTNSKFSNDVELYFLEPSYRIQFNHSVLVRI